MAGIAGFEPTNTAVKVRCLTAWRYPSINGVNDGTRTHDNQCHKLALYQLNYVHHMVRVKRFELLAHALEGRCSIQLS